MDNNNNDAQSMDLTPAEVALIERDRAEKAAKAAHKARAGLALQVAADYYAWMQETGMGLTYSHFCNDFGYEAPEGVNRSQLFSQVQVNLPPT